ncbi:hypothetical protein [Chryseobacterium sp. WLY505]|uniref:hypothetical protein n=1 Tax=Chryseobacterium sp. WLY505 TaxID=3068892 RepID=UPI0027966BDC|nr:hypothetical protein [Chryseobacterium sp. WLY505]MDQ1857276.1 hypothetical protein [Chryseobacterium sp. WLY505]
MNVGLINGLSGEALRLFLSENDTCHKKGLALLDFIAEKIFSCKDYSFENGITGFGWLIAFLHQKKYLNINSDEILEDVDDQIYKITLADLGQDEPSIDKILGLVNYFLMRYRNDNLGENYYRKFAHSECLNLLFNYLINYIENCIRDTNITPYDFNCCCKILLKLGYSIEYLSFKNVNDQLIEFHIYFILFYEAKRITSKDFENEIYTEGLLYLLMSAKQKKYEILEQRLLYIGKKAGELFLQHFIYKIYSKRKCDYSLLKDERLLFILTNYIEEEIQLFKH